MLKLYILKATEPVADSWEKAHFIDCAYGFIVQAKSPKDARLIAANQHGDEGMSVWTDIKLTTCEVLHASGTKAKVIMRDFNAG